MEHDLAMLKCLKYDLISSCFTTVCLCWDEEKKANWCCWIDFLYSCIWLFKSSQQKWNCKNKPHVFDKSSCIFLAFENGRTTIGTEMNEKWRQELTMKVFSPDLWKVEALVTLICSNQGPRPLPTIPILNGLCDGALQLFPDINLLLEQTVVGTNAMGHPLRCESEHGDGNACFQFRFYIL